MQGATRRRSWLLSLACCAICGVALADELPAVGAPEWDAVFARSEGWTGGDADYSLELGDGRVLWLFADSWIGRIADGRHAPGSRLVNNAMAVHPRPASGSAPALEDVAFHWGAADQQGHPTAWITPDPELRQTEQGSETHAGAAHPTTWYWVADGFVAPGTDGDARLYVFLWHIGRRSDNDGGVWNFQSVGGRVAVIENPHDPVEAWQVRQFNNPHAIGRETALASAAVREIHWGSAVRWADASQTGANDYVLIFGYRPAGPGRNELVLARARAAELEQFTRWEFRTRDGWSDDLKDAAGLAGSLTTEFSIDELPDGKTTRWLMVHSEPWFGPHVLVRGAAQPWGPWSKPIRIYCVPGVAKNEAYFTYAAKAHAHLSTGDELLISYIINSHDFAAAVNDADIYRPRFIRLPLESVSFEH